MAPSYQPRMTPQQQQQFQLMQYMNRQMPGALTYEQFLASRGMQNPYSQSGQTATQSPVASLLDEKTLGALGGAGALFSSSAPAGAVLPGLSGIEGAGGLTALSDMGLSSGAMETLAASPSTVAPYASSGAAAEAGALAPGIGAMPYLGAGAALAGGIGLHDAIKRGKTGQGGISGAALGGGLAMAAPLVGLGPVGWGAIGLSALGGGALGLGATKLFGRETIRDKAKKNTEKLQGQFKDDKTYQAFVRGMREQYNSGAPDPSKPFHGGDYATWDEYKKAGLDAGDLTGVKGNLELGPEYAKLSHEQRKAVTQGLIDAGLYESRKGEVEVTDAARAREIFDAAKKGGFKMPEVAQAIPKGKGPAAIMIPRSKTSSPGIGKDGKRISYNSQRR